MRLISTSGTHQKYQGNHYYHPAGRVRPSISLTPPRSIKKIVACRPETGKPGPARFRGRIRARDGHRYRAELPSLNECSSLAGAAEATCVARELHPDATITNRRFLRSRVLVFWRRTGILCASGTPGGSLAYLNSRRTLSGSAPSLSHSLTFISPRLFYLLTRKVIMPEREA
jgi:hypothetical protein